MYVRQNSQQSRLGTFESLNINVPSSVTSQAQNIGQPVSTSSSTSAASVITGIASILNPLAQAGGAIFAAKIQADAEKKAAKIQQQQMMQQQQAAMMAAMQAAAAQPPQSSTTPIILAIVGGTALLAIILVIALKKKGN